MKFIRSFFRVTRIFWILSRLVLGVIFCYCATFLLEGADTTDYFLAAFFALLGSSLLWGFFAGLFRGGAHKWFRIISGCILIILAFAAFYSTIDVFGMGDAAFILLLPVWLFTSGMFELFGTTAKKISSHPAAFPKTF